MGAFPSRIINSFRRRMLNTKDALSENNQIPERQDVDALKEQLHRENEQLRLEKEQLRREMDATTVQLQLAKAQFEEIRMPDVIDLPLTLEEINSGLDRIFHGESIRIPAGSSSGTRPLMPYRRKNTNHHCNAEKVRKSHICVRHKEKHL